MGAPQVFDGAKLALLTRERVLVMLRDDKPDIPFPGCWDLSGGGREGDETPENCAFRELHEEFGLLMSPDIISWRQKYPPIGPEKTPTWFFAAQVPELKTADIRFGDEGQEWRFMPVRMFLMHPKSVPHLAQRLANYLDHKREVS